MVYCEIGILRSIRKERPNHMKSFLIALAAIAASVAAAAPIWASNFGSGGGSQGGAMGAPELSAGAASAAIALLAGGLLILAGQRRSSQISQKNP